MFTGTTIECPTCGETMEVPDRFNDCQCPNCGTSIQAEKWVEQPPLVLDLYDTN